MKNAITTVLTAVQKSLVSNILKAFTGFTSAKEKIMELSKGIKTDAEYQLIRPFIVKGLTDAKYTPETIRVYCAMIRKGAGLTKPASAKVKAAAKRKVKTPSVKVQDKSDASGESEGDNPTDFTGKQGIDNMVRVLFTFLSVHSETELNIAIGNAKRKLKK